MSMTIKEMRDQIRSVIDIDTSDISDIVLNTMLGQGYDTIIYSEKWWPFFEKALTFTTVDGTSDYSLTTIGGATTIREISSLRTDDHVLQYVGRDGADSMYPLNSASSGVPYEWSSWDDTIRFYPTPDSSSLTVYVRCMREPSAFGATSGDGTTPDLPDPFHAILVTYGLARVYLQQEDPQMAQQYQQQFGLELDNISRRFADTPAPQPMILNSRLGSRLGGWRTRFASTGGIRW